MLRLLQLEELEALLLEVPALVSLYERRDSAFAGAVALWLKRSETALGNCRLPAAAEIASLRSRLVSADRGATPAEITMRGRATRRKLRDAVAVMAVDRAGGTLQQATSEARSRVGEAERLLKQVLAVAQQKGYPLDLGTESRWSQLVGLMQALRQDGDLAPAATHAVGLVGGQDAVILLDRCLVAFSPAASS